jgi:uncharacterized protein (DUF924 family)
MPRIKEILTFWFGEEDDLNYGKPRQEWFTTNPEFDQRTRSHFLWDYELAATGHLDTWQESPRSCLALIILLDQFPRNMFRGTPQAFATDARALAVAQNAIEHKFDQNLLPVQKWFIYLPFEHSENLEHQHQSVALFQQLNDDSDSEPAIDSAIRHLEIIKKFGRFPHRNQILGRESTPAEIEFLKQPHSHF